LGKHSLIASLGWQTALVLQLVVLAGLYAFVRWLERQRHGDVRPLTNVTPEVRFVDRLVFGPWPLSWGVIGLSLLGLATLLIAGHPWSITFAFGLWGTKLWQALGGDISSWSYWSTGYPAQALDRSVLADLGREFPDVETDAMYVDAASMWMVLHPERFDVIVTTNLFGDIISDLGAAVVGGLGSGASGNIHPGKVSVFEPIHGSAPKYTGQGVASPVGAIGAVGLMLEHVGEGDASRAVDAALREGFRTGGIKGVEGTMEVTEAVVGSVREGAH
ncbi:MAG: YeeE/YedE family protein, partial [Candidatus Rokubacteria bacterium]|nr:YeeE/YedE family protein [Candidatus Rokubacteria bacterium]